MKTIQKVTYVIIGILIAVMLVSSFLQVFTRYVMDSSLPWTEELTRYLFIWSIFLGTAVSIRTFSHIEIDVIKNMLNEKKQKVLVKINLIIQTLFFIALFVLGVFITIENARVTSPAMQMPMLYLYIVVPIASLLAVIFSIEKLFKAKEEST